MGRLYEYFRGSYTVTAKAESVCRALSLLMKNNVPFYKVKAEGDGFVSFRLEPDAFRKYIVLTEGQIIEDERVEHFGFASAALKYKMRFGFFLGALLCAALAAHGLYIGAYIPNIDAVRLENELVIESESLSYASINLRGTVAEGVVREQKNKDVEELSHPSNLIADCDGQIEAIEVRGGMPSVKRGQIVKKGQILVSGVIDSQAVGYRLVRARGEVFAKITLSYKAEIPLVSEKKVYTGDKKVKTSIKFFSKKINLFGNSEISYEKYDTIEEEKRICLFDRIELPLFIVKSTYSEYVSEPENTDEKTAYALAKKEILRQSEEALSSVQILAREERWESDGDVFTLYTDIDCIANIAKEVFIDTDGDK